MFKIKMTPENVIMLAGRFDSLHSEKAMKIFTEVQDTVIVDFKDLEYISSAGLGVLIATQKRLENSGHQLRLKNLNKHIQEIFSYAGFDMIFEIF